MNSNSMLSKMLILTSVLSLNSSLVTAQNSGYRNQYTCEISNGVPITYVQTRRGKIQLIKWENNWASESGYTPEVRCNLVTQRFQSSSDAEELKYITTGTLNQYPIICLAESVGNNKYVCSPDGILLTLESGENAPQVLRAIFQDAFFEGRTVTRGSTVVNINTILENAEVVPNLPQQEQTATETEPIPATTNTSTTPDSTPPSTEDSEVIPFPQY
jgi:hypothetical protein